MSVLGFKLGFIQFKLRSKNTNPRIDGVVKLFSSEFASFVIVFRTRGLAVASVYERCTTTTRTNIRLFSKRNDVVRTVKT